MPRCLTTSRLLMSNPPSWEGDGDRDSTNEQSLSATSPVIIG